MIVGGSLSSCVMCDVEGQGTWGTLTDHHPVQCGTDRVIDLVVGVKQP